MTEIIVAAEDVVLRYGSHVALDVSSFTIPRVGVTAVIGPNGSGKSTLLSAFAGLVPVAGGSLTVLGGTPTSARRRLAYVLQSTPVSQITPITVSEVVGLLSAGPLYAAALAHEHF